MDPTRFDRITKIVGTARSRCGVLTALSSSLADALTLLIGETVAAPTCNEDLVVCAGRAQTALEIASQACVARPSAAHEVCLSQATASYTQARQACLKAYAQCADRPCRQRGEICISNSQCCSGRCGIFGTPDFPIFACT